MSRCVVVIADTRTGTGTRTRPGLDADIVILAATSAVAAIVVALGLAGAPLGVLRVAAGLWLVGIAPGAALLSLVRPAFLAPLARVVLAIPVSLAIDALVGVLLDRTPTGLQPAAVAIAAAIVAGVLLAFAARRSWNVNSRLADGAARHPDSAVAVDPIAVEHVEGGAAVASRRTNALRLVRDRIGTLIAHLRDPLFRNAYALGMSGVITSGLGVVYWAVAARLYPADIVGVNAALLSLVTLLANVSQLNLRSGFGRFVPVAGTRTRSLVHAGYGASLVLAAVTGIGVVVLLAVAPDVLADVELTPMLAWMFPVTVLLWTAFTVQDHALVAFRRTGIVPVENGVFALAKILLLIPLASVATAYGILISWVVPSAIGVVLVSGWVLGRLVPRHQRIAEADARARRNARLVSSAQRPVTANEVVRYVGADYLGSLFAIGSTSILPVIVLATLGAASSAHFYMVSMISMATQLVPAVLATSLLVEVASSKASFEEDGRRVLRQLGVLLGPIVIVLVAFADPILLIFGPSYAAEGATALRLLAIAGIPYALINIAFIRLRLENRVRWVVAAQAALAVLLILPALLVLPVWGITGLGVVVLVSQTLVAVVLSWMELRPLLSGMFTRGPVPTPAPPADPVAEAVLDQPVGVPVTDAPVAQVTGPEPLMESIAEPAPSQDAMLAPDAERGPDTEPAPRTRRKAARRRRSSTA